VNGDTNDPAYSFNNETGTGLFFDAGGPFIGITVEGTTSVTIDATKLAIKQSLAVTSTITPGGTTGAQVINKVSGSVNFAAGASTLVVTNSLVSTSSVILATVATADTVLKSVSAIAGVGSFTLTGNGAANAETRVNFLVLNPS